MNHLQKLYPIHFSWLETQTQKWTPFWEKEQFKDTLLIEVKTENKREIFTVQIVVGIYAKKQ